jgi:hypothetical protein
MKKWIGGVLLLVFLASSALMQGGCDGKASESVVENAPADGSEGLPEGGQSEGTTAETAQEASTEALAEKTPEQNEQVPEAKPETKAGSTLAFVISSDYVSGQLGILDVNTRMWVRQEAAALSGDAVMRVWGDLLFVLNRYNDPQKEDTILVFHTNTLLEVGRYNVGAKSNPQDIVVISEQKAYVTLYERSFLLVIHPTTGEEKAKIDLSTLVEPSKKTCTKEDDCKDAFGNGSGTCNAGTCASDGLPEATKMLLFQDKVYVLLQGLDRNDGFSPVKSVLAAINTTNDTLSEKPLTMKGANPTAFVDDAQGSWLIVQNGSAFDPKDGGIERFDPNQGTLAGSFVITEESLGGNLPQNGAMVVLSPTLGYVLLSDASFKQSLVRFNPTTVTKDKELIVGADLGHLQQHEGQIFLADRSAGAFGIRILEAASGNALTQDPISTGKLPPAQILIVKRTN